VCVLDVDGNGMDDVVVSGPASREVALHLNSGDNGFSLPVTYRCTSLALGLAGGAFDGDGRGDLVVLDGLGNALVTLLSAPTSEVPVAAFELRAQRVAAGVQLTARASIPVSARRLRDGRPIELVMDRTAGDGRAGDAWIGLDPAPASGEERYALVDESGTRLAQAVAERAAPSVPAAAEGLLLLLQGPNPSAGPVAARVRSALGVPEVAVHDVRGRRLARLSVQPEQDGWYVAEWDGTDARGMPVGAGRYLLVASRAGRWVTAAITRRPP
jgi:hypothetical protein